MMPRAEAASLVAGWLEVSEAALARMRRLARAGDLTALRREAHDLAGSAGTVGATGLSDRARRLEHACEDADAEEARRLAGLVEAEALRARAALRARFRT